MELTPPSTPTDQADLLKERIANKTKEVQVLIQRGLHQFVPDVTQDLIALKQRYYDITGEWLHVAVSADASEPAPNGAAFWRKVKQSFANDGITVNSKDRAVLDELCTQKTWMDALPPGCVSSYQELYQSVRGLSSEDAQMIERDVLRTAGAVRDGASLFMDTSDTGKAGCARAMHRVLTAISVVDDTGYCQGMNYTVDFLLKCVSEESTFCLFLHLLRNHHLSCLYETQLPILSQYMDIYERQLLLRCPTLATILQSREFLAPFYAIEWFTTAWVLACPPALTLAIYDLLLFGFKDAFLRCAVAVMEVLEPQLVTMSSEELLKHFREVVVGVDPELVVQKAFQIQLQPVELEGWFLDPIAEDAEFLTMLRCRYLKEIERIDLHGRKGFAFRGSIDIRSQVEQPQPTQFNTAGLTPPEPATAPTPQTDGAEDKPDSPPTGIVADGSAEEGAVADAAAAQASSGSSEADAAAPPPAEEIKEEPAPAPAFAPTASEEQEAAVEDVTSMPLPVCPPTPVSSHGSDEAEPRLQSRSHMQTDSTAELLHALAELKTAMDVADRILGWSEVHRRWLRCSLQIPSDYMRYRIADELLRGAIASRAHIRVIAFCLAIAGSDPNSQDFALWTPLHLAVHYQRPDVVRLLLLCGADPTIKGALIKERPRPKTPEELAISENSISANMPYNATYITWPASLVILRGKVCLNCNQLFGEQIRDELKARCNHCRLVVCGPCSASHRCAQMLLHEDDQKQRRGSSTHPHSGRPKSQRLLPDVNSMRALLPGAGAEDQDDRPTVEVRSLSVEGSRAHKPKTPSRGRAFSCDYVSDSDVVRPKVTSDGAMHPRLEHTDDMALARRAKPKSPSPPTEAAIIERRPSSIRSSASDAQSQGQEAAIPSAPTSPLTSPEAMRVGPVKSSWRAFNWGWSAAAAASTPTEVKKQQSGEMRPTSPKLDKSPTSRRSEKSKGPSKLSLGSMFASISTSAKTPKEPRSREPKTPPPPSIPAYWMGYKESPKGPRSWQRALMHLLLTEDTAAPTAQTFTTERCLAAMKAPCPRHLWLRDEMSLVFLAAFRDPRQKELEAPHDDQQSSELSPNIQIIEHYYQEPRPHRGASMTAQQFQQMRAERVDSDEQAYNEARQRPWLNTMQRDWLVNENSALWIRDETVWYCRHCGTVFTLFSRKHHCRRCGQIYCDDHAPVLHVGKLLPPDMWPYGKTPGERDPNVRLCGSCVRELVKPARVLEEIKLSHRKYSLRFWTTMLNTLQRPLSAALEEHDDQELNDDLHQMTFTRLAPVRRWMTGTIRRIMGSVDASASKFSS